MVLGLIPRVCPVLDTSVPFWTFYPLVLAHYIRMKKSELTTKQLSSVTCPTCGVAAGQRCVLVSGAPRKEPHANRKLAATEAVEKERFRSAAD